MDKDLAYPYLASSIYQIHTPANTEHLEFKILATKCQVQALKSPCHGEEAGTCMLGRRLSNAVLIVAARTDPRSFLPPRTSKDRERLCTPRCVQGLRVGVVKRRSIARGFWKSGLVRLPTWWWARWASWAPPVGGLLRSEAERAGRTTSTHRPVR